MTIFISPRLHGNPRRLAATTALAAVSLTAIVSLWSSGQSSAGSYSFVLRSETAVGALSGDTLSPAVRLDPPQPAVMIPDVVAPAVAVPTVVNRSSCRTDLGTGVMTLTIPDISYKCPVFAGGQSMLNSGAVTMITDEAIRRVLADRPGGPGVFWIAAHRTSHGGAFALVPNLADGALVTLSDATSTATYRIVGRLYVGIRNDRVIDANGNATGEATLDSIIRPDHGGNGAARLLLQTCDGEGHRWMIYADLVTG